MPSSHHHQISKILDIIIFINPKTILDIGTGFGKYGVLTREYLELWDGREQYNNFIRIIDGIEVYGEYITPLHKYIYNNIYTGNALDIIDKVKIKYDLVLLIDVLEHFEQDEGELLLENILSRNKSIIISVPKNFEKQSNAFNNPYETHRSSWTLKKFKEFGMLNIIKDKYSLIIYMGDYSSIKQGLILRKKYNLNQYKLKLISYTPRLLMKTYRFFKYNLIRKNKNLFL